jgi:hypothetical protein
VAPFLLRSQIRRAGVTENEFLVEDLLRRILEAFPHFPYDACILRQDDYYNYVHREKRFRDWQLGKNLEEGRGALKRVWEGPCKGRTSS